MARPELSHGERTSRHANPTRSNVGERVNLPDTGKTEATRRVSKFHYVSDGDRRIFSS